MLRLEGSLNTAKDGLCGNEIGVELESLERHRQSNLEVKDETSKAMLFSFCFDRFPMATCFFEPCLHPVALPECCAKGSDRKFPANPTR